VARELANKDRYHPSRGVPEPRLVLLTVNFRQPRVLVIHWFRL
jgi:hypothetical protein